MAETSLSEALDELMAVVKGRSATMAQEPAEKIFPVAARLARKAIERQEQEAARKKAVQEAIEKAAPGDLIEGQGIFIGKFIYYSIGKTFYAFAAPEDLPEEDGSVLIAGFNIVASSLSRLKGWYGHDGAGYDADELFEAQKNGSYNGEWVMPPKALMDGKTPEGRDSFQRNNLCRYKDEGKFGGGFNAASTEGIGWYWSSTTPRDENNVVCIVNVHGETAKKVGKCGYLLPCRPVRLVPAPEGGL